MHITSLHFVVLHMFLSVDSACKRLTMASSQAPNLLSPNNLWGDLTDGCVNNLMSSLNKSANRAMSVYRTTVDEASCRLLIMLGFGCVYCI